MTDATATLFLPNGAGTEELYDHQKDPMEWNNLVDNPEYLKIKERLKTLVPTQREPESPTN
jgi:hypothetical protein